MDFFFWICKTDENGERNFRGGGGGGYVFHGKSTCLLYR